MRYWNSIEDSVQTALAEAITSWARNQPQSEAAWVYQVARRKVIDEIRKDAVAARAYSIVAREEESAAPDFTHEVIHDDTLRMLFVCCHPCLTPEQSIGLALRTVSGFSIKEIAAAFLQPETTIRKRIDRAKKCLIDNDFSTELLPSELTATRIHSVQNIVYLIFNEGYFSTHEGLPIREDLCGEAIRLASLLAHDKRTAEPNTHALCALILLHASRHSERVDRDGIPKRLEEQDRSRWDKELIALGKRHLALAARLGPPTAWYLEASIAHEHCRASSMESTDWSKIARLYDLLVSIRPWDSIRMAKAIAVSFAESPAAGLGELEKLELDANPNFHAARAHLLHRCGRIDEALRAYDDAISGCQTNWQACWLRTLKNRLSSDR